MSLSRRISRAFPRASGECSSLFHKPITHVAIHHPSIICPSSVIRHASIIHPSLVHPSVVVVPCIHPSIILSCITHRHIQSPVCVSSVRGVPAVGRAPWRLLRWDVEPSREGVCPRTAHRPAGQIRRRTVIIQCVKCCGARLRARQPGFRPQPLQLRPRASCMPCLCLVPTGTRGPSSYLPLKLF